MDRFSWARSPSRIAKHASRFGLRSVFLVVAICAGVLAYHMHYYEESCHVVVFVRERSEFLVCRFATVCKPLLELNDDEAFFEEVLAEPGVGQVSVIQRQADPKTWLMARLQLEIIGSSDLMKVTLRCYPYRDKGKSEELPVILNAATQVMKRKTESKFRIEVLQAPTFRKTMLGVFHQEYGDGK